MSRRRRRPAARDLGPAGGMWPLAARSAQWVHSGEWSAGASLQAAPRAARRGPRSRLDSRRTLTLTVRPHELPISAVSSRARAPLYGSAYVRQAGTGGHGGWDGGGGVAASAIPPRPPGTGPEIRPDLYIYCLLVRPSALLRQPGKPCSVREPGHEKFTCRTRSRAHTKAWLIETRSAQADTHRCTHDEDLFCALIAIIS